ncbi:hypothetical protein CRUP_007469, partial [Coryphaenoides rupestris]
DDLQVLSPSVVRVQDEVPDLTRGLTPGHAQDGYGPLLHVALLQEPGAQRLQRAVGTAPAVVIHAVLHVVVVAVHALHQEHLQGAQQARRRQARHAAVRHAAAGVGQDPVGVPQVAIFVHVVGEALAVGDPCWEQHGHQAPRLGEQEVVRLRDHQGRSLHAPEGRRLHLTQLSLQRLQQAIASTARSNHDHSSTSETP